MQNPGWVVKWICPDKDMARTIVQPEFEKIVANCPDHLKPKYQAIDSFYRFPNGSKLFLMGVNKDKGKTARGAFAHLIVCDEYAFWNCPEIVETILMPQLLTTRGQLIICSTPCEDLGHPYYGRVALAKAEDRFIERTIYDNGMLTKEDIEKAIEDSGGIDSPAFKREYLCQPVSTPERLVIPEYKPEIHVKTFTVTDACTYYVGMDLGFNDFTAVLFAAHDFPTDTLYIQDELVTVTDACTYYVGMDLGFNDFTAVLFAAHDFPTDTLYIQDELVLNGQNSQSIVDACKRKEAALWGSKTPWRRVSDNDAQQLYDFQTLYNYPVIATRKDDKQAAINTLRLRFTKQKIIIDPRCKSLSFQILSGLWNERRTDFMRGAVTGHLDAIDALIYLNRNLDMSHNPIVIEYDPFTHMITADHIQSKFDEDFQKLSDTLNLSVTDTTWGN